MSFARKLKRKDKNKTNCCGAQMAYKNGYGYVCEKCGKVKKSATMPNCLNSARGF